jgi:hypothetical protein
VAEEPLVQVETGRSNPGTTQQKASPSGLAFSFVAAAPDSPAQQVVRLPTGGGAHLRTDLLDQPLHGVLAQVEHRIEAGEAAVVRVGHIIAA